MQEALANLEKLIADNKQLFVDCKIKHDMPTGNVERIPIDKIVRMYDWIHDFLMSEEVAEWRMVKHHQPQSQWDRYKLVGLKGTREQLLLREAISKVKSRWSGKHEPGRDYPKPPFPFNKVLDAEEDQGSADGGELQPEGCDQSA